MENMPDQDNLAVEGKDGHGTTKDRDKGVVAHPHGQSGDGFVADEAQLVRDHMVGRLSVSNGKPTVMEREDNRQLGEVVENVLKTQRQTGEPFLGGEQGR